LVSSSTDGLWFALQSQHHAAEQFRLLLRAPIPANNFSSGFSVQLPLFSPGRHAKARESAATALRATVEAEQAQRQNEIQITELTGSLRELTPRRKSPASSSRSPTNSFRPYSRNWSQATARAAAGCSAATDAQSRAVGPHRRAAEAGRRAGCGFELAKARLSLLRSLGHMEDWLNELHAK